MLSADARIRFQILKKEVASGGATDDVFPTILKKLGRASRVELFRKPFEEQWNVSWHPAG